MEIKKFEKTLIAFNFENSIVNATDMMKAFPEKKMNNFLRAKQTKDFIKILEEKTDTLKSVSWDANILEVRKGGTNQGTWMHKLLALKFAAWLSPEFELFVYDVFNNFLNEKLDHQQRQLDYFWDKSDQKDLYK